MTAEQIIFLIFTVITLGSGIAVVTNKNLLHAALALMASFLGVAGYYVLLGSGFLAASQLLVYIGAISILILFAIMMTRNFMSATEKSFNSQWVLAFLVSGATFALLAYILSSAWNNPDSPLAYMTELPVLEVGDVYADEAAVQAAQDAIDDQLNGTVADLGRVFVTSDNYALPFELSSILLLAALVGSIAIAMEQDREEDEV